MSMASRRKRSAIAAPSVWFDWWYEERSARSDGHECIAGIDEAGRGALAGPVVAACVVLKWECLLPGLNDSKLIKEADRETLFDYVVDAARGIGVGIVSSSDIDRINILQATHQAMRLAHAALPLHLHPSVALIDGLPVRPFPISQVALVHGDGRSASIAAASIIAKVTRDRIMRGLNEEFPAYGFASHKGYGAQTHLRAIESLGPCPHHRLSYRPVAAAIRLRSSGE